MSYIKLFQLILFLVVSDVFAYNISSRRDFIDWFRTDGIFSIPGNKEWHCNYKYYDPEKNSYYESYTNSFRLNLSPLGSWTKSVNVEFSDTLNNKVFSIGFVSPQDNGKFYFPNFYSDLVIVDEKEIDFDWEEWFPSLCILDFGSANCSNAFSKGIVSYIRAFKWENKFLSRLNIKSKLYFKTNLTSKKTYSQDFEVLCSLKQKQILN